MKKILESRTHRGRILRHLLATPFIWIMIVPVVFADLVLEIVHRIVFPLLRIELVRRGDYIRVWDRKKLPYLTWSEKMGCAYCGYVNGWLHYASVIAGKTEEYFCAIAHLDERGYIKSDHEKTFAPYGDKKAFYEKYSIEE